MTTRRSLLLSSFALPFWARADDYSLGPDSQHQTGVPQGKIIKSTWTSTVFPGTVRDTHVYVPAQYDAAKPACVMIFQDGSGFVKVDGQWRVPVVFDNLIHKGEMPVTIGVFLDPGVLPAPSAQAQARYNRSFEYDAANDRYARFLIDEILPELRKQYNLSRDPNDYALSGASSGGIAAFAAAWYRPDVFRRVLSFIGSYTNLRGAEIYSSLVRKTEPLPLRVFQQDGQHDLNIYAGDWYLANQELSSALQFAGYDAKFVVGTEAHNGKHGGAILPDALRWLWRDYPKPIVKAAASKQVVWEIVDPTHDWEVASEGHQFTDGPACDAQGNVYFSDIPNRRIHKIALDGRVTVWRENAGGISGLMFSADGRLIACQGSTKRILAFSPEGRESVLTEGVESNDLAVNTKGDIYFTDSKNRRVWHLAPTGEKKIAHEGLDFPNGIRFSPDESLLLVSDMRNRWVWSFRVEQDGSLSSGEAFYHLETPDESSVSGADGMTLDDQGFLYVTSALGVQVCDQPGRVEAILGRPQPGALSNIVFGGADRTILFVTARDKVFRRQTRRTGVRPGQPVKAPMPHL